MTDRPASPSSPPPSPADPGPLPEDLLRQRLRQEARADTPAFSPLLHERVMTTLRAQGLASGSVDAGRYRLRGRRAMKFVWPLAGAAIAAWVAWIALHPPRTSVAPPQPRIVNQDFSPPNLAEPMRQIRAQLAPAALAFESGKYGYLDKDARHFVVFVANQFPTLPDSDTQPPR